ncbi:protein kintoun-like [Daktulosphaira vitifoliae]|uniref:protein kintoun-like n=1 Tax=Daktulosphaira vitifoliae TaxID=58002 RepID=UPI0021AAC378|nr:protein kintoun-like [Daktulosphaira vitifoliae]
MSNHCSNLEDLEITKQELDNIGEALKKEEFRKLLCEYVDEISDPKNQALYEKEITQYELERGIQVTFIRPCAGYVIKTSSNGTKKVFINICSSDVIQKPSTTLRMGGKHFSLPHCLSPGRQDYDKARKPCDVFDIIFHPEVIGFTKQGKSLKDLVEDTALTMIEKNYNLVLDKNNLKYPKISFKGIARPLVTRKKIENFTKSNKSEKDNDILGCPYPPPNTQPIQIHNLENVKKEPSFTIPKYIIKYRSDIDIQEHGYNMHCKLNAVIPKELIIEIFLPLLDTSSNIELDVLPKSLNLVCQKPSKYQLSIDLPYTVLEDNGNATFDKSAKKLIVCLPVIRKEPPLNNAKILISEVNNSNDIRCVNNIKLNEHTNETNKSEVYCNGDGLANGLKDVSCVNDQKDDFLNNQTGDNVNNAANRTDVHYILPEHEFNFINTLKLNVNNVDPSTVNVIVTKEENMISGKFCSVGSGYFPIWYSFCFKMSPNSELSNHNVKILPSDKDISLKFNVKHKLYNKSEYWYGLNENCLTIKHIDVLKENQNKLSNGMSNVSNENEDENNLKNLNSKKTEQNITSSLNQKENELLSINCQYKEKNSKNNKNNEKSKKKKGKKVQKSNAIPIISNSNLPDVKKSVDFIPGSLPVELNNNIKPTIRSILKKSRSLSECSNMEDTIICPRVFSSSVDNADTESSEMLDSSFNDSNHRKSVRFNDHVIEKKIDYSISIAAQAKKHQRRQQRKRNIREYSTPSESEASEPEDKIYGPLNEISESEETSISESSAGEMSDDNSNNVLSSKITVVTDSKKDHRRRKSKSARKNASLAKQSSTNNLIFPIEY